MYKITRVIDLFHAATIQHKNKTFCTPSLAVKILRTSLDVEKQSFFILRGDMAAACQGSMGLPLVRVITRATAVYDFMLGIIQYAFGSEIKEK